VHWFEVISKTKVAKCPAQKKCKQKRRQPCHSSYATQIQVLCLIKVRSKRRENLGLISRVCVCGVWRKWWKYRNTTKGKRGGEDKWTSGKADESNNYLHFFWAVVTAWVQRLKGLHYSCTNCELNLGTKL
jgi:hypothetical protein